MRVTCTTCHRRELHEGDRITVEVEGGARRPAEHPTLAAWHTVLKARRGGRGVIGACVCGQPLLAEGNTPWVPWSLETPEGPIVVTAEGIQGPAGALTEDGADALLEGHFGHRFQFRPALAAFQGTLMLAIFTPMALWVVTLVIVIVFLIGFGTKPGF